MKVGDLKPNPKNPRKITPEKLETLGHGLDAYGDLSGITFNVRTQRLAAGHQRVKRLPATADIVIEQTYDPPTRTGTVAEGYLEWKGERYRYRAVDWPEDTEKGANLAANQMGGEFDRPLLTDFLMELDAINFDMDLTGFDKFEIDALIAPVHFDAGTEDDQGQLDQKKFVFMECPHCGEKFEQGQARKIEG